MRNLNPNLLPLYFLLFVSITGSLRADEGLVCSFVSCGHGKCKETEDSPFSFDCECKPGWKQYPLKVESWTYPPCTIPDCTINYDCGVSAAPSGSPWTPPNIDLSETCSYVFCGDGSCVETSDGYGYRCDCSPESHNFGNSNASACLKQCSLGRDCYNLGSPNLASPSGKNGSGVEKNISSDHLLLAILLFIAIFLGWA